MSVEIVKGQEGVVNVYLMCGNTVVRAFKGVRFRIQRVQHSAFRSQGKVFVGRLGQWGCAAQTFFPRTRTDAEACRVVKFLFGGLYLKFSFDYYDTLRVCPQGTFLGAAPRPRFLVYEPSNVVCIVCMVLIRICGNFYEAVTSRLEEPKRPSEGRRNVYDSIVRGTYW